MLKHPQLTAQRLERCLNNEIRPHIYQDLTPLEVAVFQCPDPIPYSEAMRQEYRTVSLASGGGRYGPRRGFACAAPSPGVCRP